MLKREKSWDKIWWSQLFFVPLQYNKTIKNKTIMKKVLWFIVCLMMMAMSVNAQTANKTVQKDSIAASLTLSGKYLKKSANWDYISFGCAIGASGTILATQIIANSNKNEEVRNLGYLCGGMLAAWATFAYVMKIQYKWKSGKCLELYGNGVRIIF